MINPLKHVHDQFNNPSLDPILQKSDKKESPQFYLKIGMKDKRQNERRSFLTPRRFLLASFAQVAFQYSLQQCIGSIQCTAIGHISSKLSQVTHG